MAQQRLPQTRLPGKHLPRTRGRILHGRVQEELRLFRKDEERSRRARNRRPALVAGGPPRTIFFRGRGDWAPMRQGAPLLPATQGVIVRTSSSSTSASLATHGLSSSVSPVRPCFWRTSCYSATMIPMRGRCTAASRTTGSSIPGWSSLFCWGSSVRSCARVLMAERTPWGLLEFRSTSLESFGTWCRRGCCGRRANSLWDTVHGSGSGVGYQTKACTRSCHCLHEVRSTSFRSDSTK